jgi:flagellin
LSTGKSINRASDNAAGLSIRETMTAQINGLGAAIKNANDGVSQLQTADGALNEVSSMFQRMRELAVLSVNDTYSSTQKTAMSTEFSQLSAEVTRISEQTQWNGMTLLDGTAGSAGTISILTFQVGANTAQTVAVTIPVMSIGQFSINATTIATAVNATSAIAALDDSISELNGYRSTIGATINRLEHAVDNLTNVQQNATDSRSKVEDTDYAAATSELARTQIIQQAATAILAQANQHPQSVLSLLK